MRLMDIRYVNAWTHQKAFITIPTTPKNQLISNLIYQESWLQNLWVMSIIGKPEVTLVDFVSELRTMSTTALQTIRAASLLTG